MNTIRDLKSLVQKLGRHGNCYCADCAIAEIQKAAVLRAVKILESRERRSAAQRRGKP